MPFELSTKEMAEVIGVTRQRLQALASEGVIAPIGRNRWDAADVVQRLLARRSQQVEAGDNEPSEMDKLRKIRRQREELEHQRDQRIVIDLQEAVGTVERISGVYLESLSSIPARVTRNSRERQRIEAIIDEVRGRVSTRFGKITRSLREGESADEAGGEANTQ